MLITYRRAGGGVLLSMLASAWTPDACGIPELVVAAHATAGDTVAPGDDRGNSRGSPQGSSDERDLLRMGSDKG